MTEVDEVLHRLPATLIVVTGDARQDNPIQGTIH